MTLSGTSLTHQKAYHRVCLLNIITYVFNYNHKPEAYSFIIFRFFVQAWLAYYIHIHWKKVHTFYSWSCLYGGIFFIIINGCLFIRILAADGYLGEYGRWKLASKRYTVSFIFLNRKNGNELAENRFSVVFKSIDHLGFPPILASFSSH